MAASDQEVQKVLEEDTSNRSSSGSAISYSESCSYFGSEVAGKFFSLSLSLYLEQLTSFSISVYSNFNSFSL